MFIGFDLNILVGVLPAPATILRYIFIYRTCIHYRCLYTSGKEGGATGIAKGGRDSLLLDLADGCINMLKSDSRRMPTPQTRGSCCCCCCCSSMPLSRPGVLLNSRGRLLYSLAAADVAAVLFSRSSSMPVTTTSLCLYLPLSVSLSVCLFLCLSLSPSLSLAVSFSVCLSLSVSLCLSLSLRLFLSLSLFLCLSLGLAKCL